MEAHSLHNNQWKWYQVDFSDSEKIEDLLQGYYINRDWIGNAEENRENTLDMNSVDDHKKSIWGSLVYVQDPAEQKQQEVFHFYLTEKFLITGQLDFSKLKNLETNQAMERVNNAKTPIEGFMVIVDEITTDFLKQIDKFERDINELLWKIQNHNDESTLDSLMMLRHQLLVVKNLIIPVQELKMGIEEAFGEDVTKGAFFKKTGKRIDRCQRLIKEYQEEIATMVDLENVVSAVRGNEIMKTLTVFTIMYTPLAAWGALWGMNFKFMPELNEKFGYLFALLFILFNTLILLGYLKKKGWLGDLLQGKKKKSFFK